MKNNYGFGILEVVIAASVLSILTLGISTVIIDLTKSKNYIEDQLQKTQIIRNIESILSSNSACTASLSGTVINLSPSTEVNLTSLKDQLGNDVFVSNTNYDHLRVGQITVRNQSVPSPSSSGFIVIKFPVTRLRTGGGPTELKPYESMTTVTVDPAQSVINCLSDDGGLLYGVAPVSHSSAGSYRVTLMPPLTAPAQNVSITPKWNRQTGDEDVAFWVTNVDNAGFTIHWSGPGGGINKGEPGIYWTVRK